MGEGRSHIQFVPQSSATTAEIVSLKGSLYLYINTSSILYPEGLSNHSVTLIHAMEPAKDKKQSNSVKNSAGRHQRTEFSPCTVEICCNIF